MCGDWEVLLESRLRGEPPFYSKDPNSIMRRNAQNDYTLADMHWENISPDGKDLLEKMMKTDPEERIPVYQALKHPWITNRNDLLAFKGKNRNQNLFSL